MLSSTLRKGKGEKGEKGKGKGGKGKSEPEKPYLLVDPDLGAGVELTPTCWGMHVDLVEEKPGQPHLTAGCTITAIDGKNLLGLADEDRIPAHGVCETWSVLCVSGTIL